MKKVERINTNCHVEHLILKRNKNFPNSNLPVLIYKAALKLPRQKNRSSSIIRQVFLNNDWSNTWVNGIYDLHHYHSITHECMGIGMGSASIILGGPNGRSVELTQGDVIIIPAGVGHKCTRATENFVCIGAYPQGKNYDTNTGTADELSQALKNIEKLSIPSMDPLSGKEGFLKAYWK